MNFSIRIWLAAFDFCAGLRYLYFLAGSQRLKIVFLCWLSLFNLGLMTTAGAQTAISSGAAISNGAKLIPPPQPLCLITTNSLPGATQGVFYSQTILTSGCAAPVTFSITAGALPTWVTTVWPNTTGKIEGTPGLGDVGTSASFTITATDANLHKATFAAGFSVATGGSANTPLLPDAAFMAACTTVACSPSPNTVITVGDGTASPCSVSVPCNWPTNQLASAIALLQCGQTLVLQNTVYFLPNGIIRISLPCDAAHWLTIRNDPNETVFPPEGTRIDPCYAGIPQTVLWYHPYPTADLTPNTCARRVPLLMKGGAGTQVVFSTASVVNPGAAYIRFIGIQWGRPNTYNLDFGTLSLLNNAECTAGDVACMNHQPQHIIFDRNLFTADAQREDTRGLLMGGCRDCAILDSWFMDYKLSYGGGGGDANAWAGGIGKWVTNVGRWKVHNNYFNASTEGQIQGGGFLQPLSAATGFDGTPHDIWDALNFYRKTPLMDTQIGQTQNAAVSIDGQSYGPAPAQEFVPATSAIQLAVNQNFIPLTWTANDSNGGINRSPAGTNALACTGACGVATTQFGSDPTGANSGANVGTGMFASGGQFLTLYQAPASVPGSNVTYTRSFSTPDGSPGYVPGHSLTMKAITTFTIVASNPIHKVVVAPQAADLKIQPSYIDAAVCTPASPIACGNTRQFCQLFYAEPNFTFSSITWAVDGTTTQNPATVGTWTTQDVTWTIRVPLKTGTDHSVNGSSLLWCSPTSSLGSHTITATTDDATVGSSAITVANSAPIVAFDGKTFTSKNGWELKTGNRILFEKFLIEVAWGSQGNGGGQLGECFLAQNLNQNGQTTDENGIVRGYGPEFTNDITMRDGICRYAGKVGSVSGHALFPSGLGMNRYLMTDFLGDDVNDTHWTHNFSAFVQTFSFLGDGSSNTSDTGWTSATNPVTQNVFFTKSTIVGHSTNAIGITNNLAQFPLVGLTVQNNLWMAPGSTTFVNANGEANDCNTAQGTGANNTEFKALAACWIPHVLDHMALLDSTASTSNFLNPTLIWPIAATLVGFANYNGAVNGDYRLCHGPGNPVPACTAASIFAAGQANQASDGSDLGAAIPTLTSIETQVRSGVRTP